MWQWWNHYCTQVPRGKRLLRVNLDETVICLNQNNGPGNLFLSKNLRMTQNISRGTRRTYLNHVALVCDDPSMSCTVYMRAARDPHSITFLAPASAVRCYEPHVFGARSRFQSRQPDNAVQSFRAKRGPLFALWLHS